MPTYPESLTDRTTMSLIESRNAGGEVGVRILDLARAIGSYQQMQGAELEWCREMEKCC